MQEPSRRVHLTGDHRMVAAVGQRLVVVLTEIPTSGFLWRLVPGLEPSCVAVRNLGFQASAIGIGAAGTRTFEVLCAKAGAAILIFELQRPWEADPPKSRIALKLEILS